MSPTCARAKNQERQNSRAVLQRSTYQCAHGVILKSKLPQMTMYARPWNAGVGRGLGRETCVGEGWATFGRSHVASSLQPIKRCPRMHERMTKIYTVVGDCRSARRVRKRVHYPCVSYSSTEIAATLVEFRGLLLCQFVKSGAENATLRLPRLEQLLSYVVLRNT